MATVHGRCGALLAARDIAHELGLTLSESDFRQLDSVRKHAAAALATARAEAAAWIDVEKRRLAAMRKTLEAHKADFVAVKSHAFAAERAELERRVARLRTWGKGIRRILTAAPVLWLRWKLARIRVQVSGFRRALEEEQRALEGRHAALSNHPEVEIKRLTRRVARRLNAIDELRRRRETAGAVAELALLDELGKLPDGFHVINNLKLRADSYLRDTKGAALQSAQIDHLVVGPTGVFVIETKNWSKRFAESGRGHDPYDQVERANRLCYVLLKESGRGYKVRSILACRGHVPPKREGSYVKPLSLHEVRGYITRFSHDLAESQMERTTQFFLDRDVP